MFIEVSKEITSLGGPIQLPIIIDPDHIAGVGERGSNKAYIRTTSFNGRGGNSDIDLAESPDGVGRKVTAAYSQISGQILVPIGLGLKTNLKTVALIEQGVDPGPNAPLTPRAQVTFKDGSHKQSTMSYAAIRDALIGTNNLII